MEHSNIEFNNLTLDQIAAMGGILHEGEQEESKTPTSEQPTKPSTEPLTSETIEETSDMPVEIPTLQ